MKKLSLLFLVIAMVLSLLVPVSAKRYTAGSEDDTITNEEGSEENALKVISGSVDVDGGAMTGTDAILQLATPVTFSASKKWAIEFELSGLSGEFAVLSAEADPSSYNIVYLPKNGDLAPVVSSVWYRVTDSSNAVTANINDIAALNNFDATARHIYRIENHGSDGWCYYLDGVKVGVYGQGAGGITNRSNGSDIARTLSSDFTVGYIGMKRWPLNATLYDLSLYTENSEIAFAGDGTLPAPITTITPEGKDERQLYPTDKVTLPAPLAVPTGKVFVGWKDGNGKLYKTSDTYTVTSTGTTTLTASYAEAALAGTLMVVFNSDNTFSARLINANNADDLRYQWMRDGVEIEGATGATYTMTADDCGHQISCKATSTLQSGELTSQSMTVTSAANGTVQGNNIVMALNAPIRTPTDKNWAIEFKLSDITKEQQAILSDMANEQEAANIRALYLYPTGDLAIIRNNVWYFTPEYTKPADFDAKAEHTYRIENRAGTVSYYLDGTKIGGYSVRAPGGVAGRTDLAEGKPQLDVTYQYLGIERTANKGIYKFDGKLHSLASFENNSTVAFNANYEGSATIPSIDSFGTGNAQRQLYVGDVITLPAAPTRVGYDFGGWSYGAKTYDAESQYTVPATGMTTLTAQWKAHALTKTDATPATCTENGNNEYYTCKTCHKVFKDAAGTQETTVAAETLTKLGHNMAKIEAKAVTCTEDGNNEYYICNVCHKVFKDQAGTQETTVADEIVKAPGKHDWSNHDGICKVCQTPCGEVHTAGTTCKVCGKYTPAPAPVTPVKPSKPAKPSFNPDAGKTKFVDVSDNAWYASAADYVVDKGLMNGTGEDKFSPNADTTRGMIVTVLARLDGKSTAGTPWYAAGQRWAMEYEISDGTNMTGAITREQLVAMLFRYAVKNGLEAVTLSENLTQFTDASDISAWAVSAMQWAVGQGLIQGSNGLLRPQANASRAEVATILMRFCELMKK